MPRKVMNVQEKLIYEISCLSEENWKKVRQYVAMLRRVERMRNKAFNDLVKTGYATKEDKSLIREEDMYCDFCGRNAKTVKRLLAGEDGYICDECVRQCCEVLKEEYENTHRKEKKKL